MTFFRVSEADACRFLGRGVTVTLLDAVPAIAGRLSHVSSTKAFVVTGVRGVPSVHAVRLADILRIDAIDRESIAV